MCGWDEKVKTNSKDCLNGLYLVSVVTLDTILIYPV